ncbi:hypothetical protein PTKIN_Ptkin02bG0228600 [Pterospermum kingtungense]
MLRQFDSLEELTVSFPFTSAHLQSWLSLVQSLKCRELRIDDDHFMDSEDTHSKLMCINGAAKSTLESLKLSGVEMVNPPQWTTFERLQTLEVVGARFA